VRGAAACYIGRMSRCVHCQRQKGKRACPALGGSICSLCCGRHRLVTIACPSDCSWLGGLAVVRSEEPIGEFPRAALDDATDRLGRYSSGAGRALGRGARVAFLGDEEPVELDDWAQMLFVGYLIYGYRDAGGKRMVDRFAETSARDLGRDVALAVRSLRAAWAALFTVEEVHEGAGLVLRDVLGGEPVRVTEVSATFQLRRGQLLFAWLFPVGDRVEMTGASCLVPGYAEARVLAAVRGASEEAAAVAADAAADGRDRSGLAPLVFAALEDAIRERPLPRMVNRDGDEVVFCKAHFDVRDQAALRERLAGTEELEDDGEGGFTWFGGPASLGDGRSIQGRVVLSAGSAVLEADSPARLERGKRLLAKRAEGAIVHRADTVQSIEAMMRERPRQARRGDDGIPDDVKAQLVGEMLRKHYATWADVPLPALDGKTPRKAIRSKRGRAAVRALVEEIEHGTRMQPGGEHVDFGALRRDLGLDDDENADEDGGRYEAAVAPEAGAWLGRDEQQRIGAVERFHRNVQVHPPMDNARLHALVHVVVENQLALGDPRETVAAMERLRAAGLSRHEALHAVGTVVFEELSQLTHKGRGFDRDAMNAALAALAPGRHPGSAPR
jgi:hypothetical protein